jgi:hypothetical protein
VCPVQTTIAGIDEKLVRRELIRLRDLRFSSRADFVAASGLYHQLIQQVDNGSIPRLNAMSRWTEACGKSLDEFLKHCRELQHGGVKDFSADDPLISDLRSLLAKNPQAAEAVRVLVRTILSGVVSHRK